MTKEEKRIYDIEYRAKNKDKYKENNRAWRLAHPDRMKEIHKEWRAKNPDRVRSAGFKNRYGITADDYDQMLQSQRGKCSICSRNQKDVRLPFVIDHNHETGKIRGLLCFRCNTGIGQLCDDIGLLKKAIAYLESHK